MTRPCAYYINYSTCTGPACQGGFRFSAYPWGQRISGKICESSAPVSQTQWLSSFLVKICWHDLQTEKEVNSNCERVKCVLTYCILWTTGLIGRLNLWLEDATWFWLEDATRSRLLADYYYYDYNNPSATELKVDGDWFRGRVVTYHLVKKSRLQSESYAWSIQSDFFLTNFQS